jgi:hypothetical protein
MASAGPRMADSRIGGQFAPCYEPGSKLVISVPATLGISVAGEARGAI